MLNWTLVYHSRGQELLLKHKCSIYTDLFYSVCHLAEGYMSPFRYSSVKVKVKVCMCLYVCVHMPMCVYAHVCVRVCVHCVLVYKLVQLHNYVTMFTLSLVYIIKVPQHISYSILSCSTKLSSSPVCKLSNFSFLVYCSWSNCWWVTYLSWAAIFSFSLISLIFLTVFLT